MNPLAIVRIAFRALSKNKLRSTLTMLGIIIGVGAVIAMVSIGQGAQSTIQDQISSIGQNMLFIWPGSSNQGGMRVGAGTVATLTADDIEAIERECSAVRWASPGVRANAQIVFGNQNWFTNVQGVNQEFPSIRKWKVDSGEFFTETDVRTAARVALLGKTVVSNLFPGIDPVGQTIRVRNLPFRVLGVLAARGQNQMGQDQDDTLIVPYTTVQKKLLSSITNINYAMVSAVSPTATFTAQQQVTELLRQRHRTPPNQDDDFQVRNLTDVADAAEETNRIMTRLLGSVASVSLLVGGIGIMNIMLVSVTERTREIGIHMAVGARSGHIRLQFLTESVVLSMIGGLIGVAFGIAISIVISRLLQWPTLVSPISIAISFLFAAGVGILFGYYPASKAAGLDPIEALRYE